VKATADSNAWVPTVRREPGEVQPPGSDVVRVVYRKRRGNCLMIPLLRVSAIMRMWLWILS
jgi:hypothetical protein